MDSFKTFIVARVYPLTFKWGHYACHQLSERSFYVKGRQLPVCARCLGLYAGLAVGLCTVGLLALPPLLVGVMVVPMIIDGLAQSLTKYRSTNLRRFATGIMFGFAFISAIKIIVF